MFQDKRLSAPRIDAYNSIITVMQKGVELIQWSYRHGANGLAFRHRLKTEGRPLITVSAADEMGIQTGAVRIFKTTALLQHPQ